MLRQLETPLEAAPRDAAMQEGAFFALRLVARALHDQRAFVEDDLQILLAEPGDGHLDAIATFVDLLDVVGRERKSRLVDPGCRLKGACHAVETDGGAEQRWSRPVPSPHERIMC